MRYDPGKRLSVKEAAERLCATEDYVRRAMRQGTLNIGSFVQNPGGKYTYHISPKLLEEYIGHHGTFNQEAAS